jgi:hypothetical protein
MWHATKAKNEVTFNPAISIALLLKPVCALNP